MSIHIGDRVEFTAPDNSVVQGTVWSNGTREGRLWVLGDDANSYDLMRKYLTPVGMQQLALDFDAVSA